MYYHVSQYTNPVFCRLARQQWERHEKLKRQNRLRSMLSSALVLLILLAYVIAGLNDDPSLLPPDTEASTEQKPTPSGQK